MDVIKISCPAGSGMNFAQQLLQKSLYNAEHENNIWTGGHERIDILEEVPTLVILRNPYDAVASATERHLRSANHDSFKNDLNLIEDSDMHTMVGLIATEKYRYLEFFRDIEDLPHVKILTFETLTQKPEIFVEKVVKHFEIKSKIIKRSSEEIIKAVIDSGNENRVPRKISPGRHKIDLLIRAMYPGEEMHSLSRYLHLKEKIEKGLM
jgi:hypothetical protein